MRYTWFRTLLRRRLAVILLLIMQIWFLVYIFQNESHVSTVLRTVVQVISGFLVLSIISKKDKGANKVAWVFLILLFQIWTSGVCTCILNVGCGCMTVRLFCR